MPYWRLFYHFVWGTHQREPTIEARFEASLHNAIAAKAKKLGAFVYAVGGVDDHVHLVASVPPKVALSDFIGQIKGNTSHFVNQEFTPRQLFSWQQEYGVVSFSGKQLDMVVKYVKAQKAHHQTGSTITFLERVEAET